ncbi:ribosomal protein S18-alanine N-acetyltransferase [Marinobacter sediminum]|uniref:ribosomal protein S18-alanine N-acetyltransferase n=1 Tax=Marinobacter sediminum TaxID=256323 RepID=UPI00202DEB4A|nr:ribosomal protein S18-alanine N-acetyltransferase [Marinobacter sediminum]MCM0611012.1 ribosomal protein S18-alanine N-acetyltransferase [Marinobacter sediminum]
MSEPDTYRAVMGSDLFIRELLPGDLPQVLEIERQGYSHPWAETVFRDCFRENYRLWAAWRGDVLVGYAVVAYMFDEAHLLNLCIHPDSRGQGTARLLLRHMLAEASREQMWQVILEVRTSNAVANGLYASEGFEEIGRRPDYYPGASGREDACVMVFRLRH